MKKKILIANVGTSDITVHDNYLGGKNYVYPVDNSDALFEKEKSFLDRTMFLKENIDEYIDDINLPILEPIIEKYEEFEYVFLIVTNQEDSNVSIDYKNKDTYIGGEIIKRVLKDRYKVNNVRLWEADFDCSKDSNINKFLSRKIQKCSGADFKESIKGYPDFYVSITGGMPSFNRFLLLNSIDTLYPVEFVEVVKSGKVKIFNHKDNVEYFFLNRSIEKLIESWEYSSARRLLEDSSIDFTNKSLVRDIIYIAESLLFLNLEEAQQEINNLRANRGELEFINIVIGKDLTNIEYKIFLLTLSIEVYIKQGRYTDATARIYALWDNVISVYLLDRRDFDFKWEDDSGYLTSDAKEYIENNELQTRIEALLGRKFDFERTFSTTSKIAVLYALEDAFDRYLKSLIKLIGKRNKTYIAHDLSSITKNDFIEIFGGVEQFLTKSQGILSKLDFQLYTDWRNKLHEDVKRYMKK